VAGGGLRDAGLADGTVDGALQDGLVQIVTPPLASRGLGVDTRRLKADAIEKAWWPRGVARPTFGRLRYVAGSSYGITREERLQRGARHGARSIGGARTESQGLWLCRPPTASIWSSRRAKASRRNHVGLPIFGSARASVLLEQPPTLTQRLAHEAIASSLPCELLNLYAQLRTAMDKVAPSCSA
jgi:hypothetical protein